MITWDLTEIISDYKKWKKKDTTDETLFWVLEHATFFNWRKRTRRERDHQPMMTSQSSWKGPTTTHKRRRRQSRAKKVDFQAPLIVHDCRTQQVFVGTTLCHITQVLGSVWVGERESVCVEGDGSRRQKPVATTAADLTPFSKYSWDFCLVMPRGCCCCCSCPERVGHVLQGRPPLSGPAVHRWRHNLTICLPNSTWPSVWPRLSLDWLDTFLKIFVF